MLIFLYPPSRLGLTSPIGGAAGQVVLDSRGEIVKTSPPEAGVNSASVARLKSCPPEDLRSENLGPANSSVNSGEIGAYPQALKRVARPNPRFSMECTTVTQ